MEDKRLVFRKGKQNELLTNFMQKQSLGITALGRLIGVSKTTARGYYSERNNIKLSTFQTLVSIDKNLSEFGKYIENQLPINWGAKKGGKERVKLMQDVNSYYFKIREIKKIKELEDAKAQKLKIQPHPFIEKMKHEGVDLTAVLAVCLLTDGSLSVKGNHYRIAYCSNDEILRDIVFSIINELSVKIPAINFTKKANYLIRVSDEILGKRLLLLSPNYKTSPSWYQTKEQYLQELQPTLKFLSNASEQTKLRYLSFGLTADGCISYRTNGKASVELACYHPTLAFEWKEFIESTGFTPRIVRNVNSWCGLAGLKIQKRAEIELFYKLGGFIDGVKISKKSKRFCGMSKNELLKKVVNGKGEI